MKLWLLVWVNLELVQLRLLVVIECSVRPHLSFFVALHHQNTPAIVSTTGDSTLENVALTHTHVRSAEGHTLRNNVTLGKPTHHQNQVTTKLRMQEKPQTTTSLLMETSITSPIKANRLDYWLKGYDELKVLKWALEFHLQGNGVVG